LDRRLQGEKLDRIVAHRIQLWRTPAPATIHIAFWCHMDRRIQNGLPAPQTELLS